MLFELCLFCMKKAGKFDLLKSAWHRVSAPPAFREAAKPFSAAGPADKQDSPRTCADLFAAGSRKIRRRTKRRAKVMLLSDGPSFDFIDAVGMFISANRLIRSLDHNQARHGNLKSRQTLGHVMLPQLYPAAARVWRLMLSSRTLAGWMCIMSEQRNPDLLSDRAVWALFIV